MSLLLMSKLAKRPFYYDKLNIRLFSAEELAYCIYQYPLLAMDGLVDENLTGWIGRELQEERLAEELENRLRAGESQENMLLEILQSANYYTQAEIRSFRNMILELKKKPKAEFLREEARTCCHAGRLYQAEEKYLETVRELTASLAGVTGEEEIRRINEEKADVLCDLVAVRMLRFDEAGAMKYIELAEETERCQRAEEYRYLISGSGILSEEEKQTLDAKRRELTVQASAGSMCRKIREISGLERDDLLAEAGKIVREWKKEYRKTS